MWLPEIVMDQFITGIRIKKHLKEKLLVMKDQSAR